MRRASGVQRRGASLFLMVASGFAGLGYQIVWTQECALWLGHETAAVLAVVAAFFGGLAMGALALGSRIESSRRPVRWYAGCELVIALWSLLLIVAMPPFSAWALRLMGAQPAPAWQWLVAFLGTFFLLLPATAAMGATLPAMERLTARLREPDDVRSLAALYAGNTFGAVLGVLATAFWLVPALGLARTTVVCVALNLACGVTSLAVFVRNEAGAFVGSASFVDRFDRRRARAVTARLALTGFLGIGYEVLVVRVLSQVAENTVYTFAVLLAIYLVGSAGGAAVYHRALRTRRDLDALGEGLLGALGVACVAGTASLWSAERVKALAAHALGGSVTGAIVAEAVPALLAFGPPTLVMGALFSHLGRTANATGLTFGRALGVNTLGAAAAPFAFGVLALPALGPKLTLLSIGGGYLALARWRSWSRPVVWAPAAGALALALFAPPLAFLEVPDGGRVVSYEDGVMAAVSVVEDADGVARLRINNRQQEGSSATRRVDGRQAWLPLLLHPAPRTALFLGLGTGVTAATAAEDPTLEVDAVELLPEVITAAARFTQGASRLHVVAGDARRYVRASRQSYDVIVSDNFHPARSGSGSLYTAEHFEAVRLRLAADGVFCQWLPLHQLDLATVRSIVRSFLTAFPGGAALLANNSLETPVLGLIGRREATAFDVALVHERILHVSTPWPLARLGLEDELAVLGSFVAGPAALRRFAADAPVNSDDRPVVAYRAPRITYDPDSSVRERLSALLAELSIAPRELIATPSEPAWPARLAAYWTARDRFIESGRAVRPSGRVEDMLAQVREPLLAVLRISPDFRPAYDPLLAMADTLARSDASGARALLDELSQLQPARDEAPRALARLASENR